MSKHQKVSKNNQPADVNNSYRGAGKIHCTNCKAVFDGPRAERLAIEHFKAHRKKGE